MEKKYFKQNDILVVILLFICVGVTFLIASRSISRFATESCFKQLRQTTQEFCRELNNDVESDHRLLVQIADQLAKFEKVDSDSTKKILSSFVPSGSMVRLELLLPDDHLIQPGDTIYNAADMISFTEEVTQGCHISGRMEDYYGSGSMILRYFVPVEKKGNIEAILCGVIDLEKISDFLALKEYNGSANLYVIEESSGDFLVDTLHSSLGNIYELGNRPVKKGYNTEQVTIDMANGTAGRTAFRSFSYGEYLYCDYAPAGINGWMVMLSLPENVVMAKADQILSILYLLAAVEALCLFIYFAWVLSRIKKETKEKDIQLNRVKYMLDIEETLFGAARNPKQVEIALQKVAKMLTARGAFLLLCNDLQKQQIFVWLEGGVGEGDQRLKGQFIESFFSLKQRLKKGEIILSYNPIELEEKYGLPQNLGIQNMMLVPVLDDDRPIGILGVANMSYHWKNSQLLNSVLLSFSLAANNIENFRLIQELGMLDHLTGLLNRNSFQEAMEYLEKGNDYSLACVYIDADGLHELNNRCGHEAGDMMLRTVAAHLKNIFGPDCTYRIGGDEFVAFCTGFSDLEIEEDINRLEAALASQGYHISIGVELRRNIPLIFELVKQAELKMYEAKREYYKSLDAEACAREMDQKLEQMVREKRDLEVFRQALASKYRGVYIVDLKLDTMRYIYIPSYFEKIIKNSNGKFSESMNAYASEIILPEYQQAFLDFVTFEHIEKQLDHGESPEFRYQNAAGEWVFLKVYRSPEYTWRTKESVWSFENIITNLNMEE